MVVVREEPDTNETEAGLEVDYAKPAVTEKKEPITKAIPYILKNRVTDKDWNRIRRFCNRYDTKCALLNFYKNVVPCCEVNPVLVSFVLGLVYALAATAGFVWYVITYCDEGDEDGLCGTMRFAVIPAVVAIPPLFPNIYLMMLAISEFSELEGLAKLLFQSLYGYPSVSVHFVYCPNGETFRNAMNVLLRKSREALVKVNNGEDLTDASLEDPQEIKAQPARRSRRSTRQNKERIRKLSRLASWDADEESIAEFRRIERASWKEVRDGDGLDVVSLSGNGSKQQAESTETSQADSNEESK